MRNWSLHQQDVLDTFLHGILKDRVYMRQPLSYKDRDKPEFVCQLRKWIYDLKQSPKAWFHRLHNFIIILGFKKSLFDQSLFVFIDRRVTTTYFLVYVDDIMLATSLTKFITNMIKAPTSEFTIKEL